MANEIKPTEYKLLEPLPGVTKPGQGDTTDTVTYMQGLFTLIITIAIVLAVLRIIYGGFIKLSSDAWTKRSEANDIIYNAIFGLILTLGAWIIVATVLGSKDGKLDFNLAIPREEVRQVVMPESAEVGCQGNCSYSYTNAGRVIKYKDCINCSRSDSFGLSIKTPYAGGQATKINTDLGNKLKAVKDAGGLFQVTETWPPTVNHANQKQYNGTAVDVSVPSGDSGLIRSFLTLSEANGLRAIYEVKDLQRKNQLIGQGVPAGKILIVPRITGEHFSVE